jgi:hypothetical protein
MRSSRLPIGGPFNEVFDHEEELAPQKSAPWALLSHVDSTARVITSYVTTIDR